MILLHRLLPFLLIALMGRSLPALEPAPAVLDGQLPGCPWSIVLSQPASGRNAPADLADAGAMLRRQWNLLALDGQGSELARVNAQAGVQSARMGRGTFNALLAALEWKERSLGAVDPLAGPLLRWWGLPNGKLPPKWPTAAELDSLAALVHRGGIFVVELGVLLRDPGMELDLDPLLPGVLADCAVDSLGLKGQGSRVQVAEVWRNARPEPWSVALPASEAWAGGDIRLGSGAFARVRTPVRGTVEGRAAGPVVDPRSGLPVEGVEAWAFAPTALDARALALSLAVAGQTALDSLGHDGTHLALATRDSAGKWNWHATTGFPVPLPPVEALHK